LALIRFPRDVGERVHVGGIASLPFQKGATGAEVPFHNNVIGNFVVYQDRIERNLLQLPKKNYFLSG